MSDQPILTTARLILRPFTPSDAPDVQRLAGEFEVADTTLNIPHPYPDGVAEGWIGTHATAWLAQTMVTYAVTLPTTGELLGASGLQLTMHHRRGELGYWVARPHWGRGYATEAGAELLRLGFETLKLNRIQATHMTRNPASGRVMQKLGMTFEGVQRGHYIKNDQPVDIARYAILRGEWEQRP